MFYPELYVYFVQTESTDPALIGFIKHCEPLGYYKPCSQVVAFESIASTGPNHLIQLQGAQQLYFIVQILILIQHLITHHEQ